MKVFLFAPQGTSINSGSGYGTGWRGIMDLAALQAAWEALQPGLKKILAEAWEPVVQNRMMRAW